MPYLGVLGSNIEKTVLYLKSAPLNLSYCKVWCKKNILKLWTKNALFGCFWAEIWKY